jgi:hypothetical protein
MSTTVTPSESKPALGAIWKNGLIATAIAVIINALLFLLGSTFTFPAEALTPMGAPITIGPVVILTLLAGLVATIGYTVLTRFLAISTANRVMWIVAVVVLIGMFFSPFGIENVPLAEIVILEVMHLVAGLIPVYLLTRG